MCVCVFVCVRACVCVQDGKEEYRVRVLDLWQRTGEPGIGEPLGFDLVLDFYFKGPLRPCSPMAVNENMDIVVAKAFEIHKWNVKHVLDQKKRSSRPLKYAVAQWQMQRKAAFVPDNLDIGENTIEYGESRRKFSTPFSQTRTCDVSASSQFSGSLGQSRGCGVGQTREAVRQARQASAFGKHVWQARLLLLPRTHSCGCLLHA